MLYSLYITHNGTPKTGLSPNWETLLTAENGIDKSASAPVISEVGGGWYNFTIEFGTAPWDVETEGLFGVVDADPTDAEGMADAERYVPIDTIIPGTMTATLTGTQATQLATAALGGTVVSPEGIPTVGVTYQNLNEYSLILSAANGIQVTFPAGYARAYSWWANFVGGNQLTKVVT